MGYARLGKKYAHPLPRFLLLKTKKIKGGKLMSQMNESVLNIDSFREKCVMQSIDYLLSRKMGIRGQMPHFVKTTLIDFRDDYLSELKKLKEEN